MQIVFVLAVIIAGIFAAEISFLFGLPVLTLGSDYFGIATLGFTIIVKVLLDNSDTMLGFAGDEGRPWHDRHPQAHHLVLGLPGHCSSSCW